jgi:hypothetical protein
MASILQYVGLRRRFSLTVPGAIASTQANLRTALGGDIVLSGSWQPTRRYWGQLSSSGTPHPPWPSRPSTVLLFDPRALAAGAESP